CATGRGSPAAAATSTRGSAGAKAGAPNLFARPLLRPLGARMVVVVVDRGLRRVELVELLDLEAVRAQESDPVAVAELELDLVRVGPFDLVESALRTLQRLHRAALGGRTQHGERRVAQEHEQAARPQQPRRLGDPLVGIAPDRRAVLREREVERGVRETRLL